MSSGSRTQVERTAVARKNLLAAARALIASKGSEGFSLAEVGELAGVSRGLSGYHFKSRGALLRAAYEELLGTPPPEGEPGVASLLTWMNDQLRRAAGGDPDVLALLQLAVGPGVSDDLAQLRQRYWDERIQYVQAHLRRARVLERLRPGLDPVAVAPLVISLLHGEMSRGATTDATLSPPLGEFLRGMLEPGPQDAPDAVPARKRKRKRSEPPPQGGLFGEG